MTSPSDDHESAASRRATRRFGLLVGLGLSLLLGAALVIPAAKAGITPGVSPLVVLFGWVVFGAALGPRLRRFLAIAQVTGSGGAAVTAGVVFTAPIVQILIAERIGRGEMAGPVPAVDVPLLTLASLAGALLGFGFVGLATRRFLTDPRLPAPEATACDRLIRTAIERPDERPALGPSLFAGLAAGAALSALTMLGWMGKKVHELQATLFGGRKAEDGSVGPDFSASVEAGPVYVGIGALLTLPTALLIFSGGLVNSTTSAWAAANAMPGTTFRWVGGAAMVVAVIFSLIHYVLDGRRRAGKQTGEAVEYDEALLEQPPRVRRMLYASVAAGMALLLVMMFQQGVPTGTVLVIGAVALVLVSLLSGLGGLLSLQVGSSASPVSGTVFMGMLALSLTALGMGLSGLDGVIFLVPIVVAACVAICAANDSSQDYKTMQLNGLVVSESFIGQLLGLIAGALVVPATLALAHGAYGLGTEELPSPQASFFSTVLQSLFMDEQIPWGPVGVGSLLGLVAVGVEIWGRTRGIVLSSLAFAVGIYLPAAIGMGIMLGALARFLATRRVSASTHEGILTAAGIITGDALVSLVLGLCIVGGVNLSAWGPASGVPPLGAGVGAALLAFTLLIVWRNYRQRRATR